jgi:hypothetical protein
MSPDSTHFATIHKEGTVAFWNIDSIAYYAVTDSVFTPSIDSVSYASAVCADSDAEFSVSATSNFGQELAYQWQKGGVALTESDSVSGVHTAKLLLKNIDKSDAGSYSVVVSSLKNSSIASQPAVLTVRDLPAITTQPAQKTELHKGDKAVLKITIADTTGAQFQWFKNGDAITGAVKSELSFTADSASTGVYTVRVTNQCGSVMSNEAEVVFLTTDIAEENPFKTTNLTAEPNPFKVSTTIRFSLEKLLKIKLAVTDVLGREVAVLKDEFVEMGEQHVIFKNEELPQGTYFVTLSGDGFLKTIPVQVVR